MTLPDESRGALLGKVKIFGIDWCNSIPWWISTMEWRLITPRGNRVKIPQFYSEIAWTLHTSFINVITKPFTFVLVLFPRSSEQVRSISQAKKGDKNDQEFHPFAWTDNLQLMANVVLTSWPYPSFRTTKNLFRLQNWTSVITRIFSLWCLKMLYIWNWSFVKMVPWHCAL